MSDFSREFHNPIELIKEWWPEANIDHITFDPSFKSKDRDYWRVASSGGDGTYQFTIDMLKKCLLPLVNKSTYYNKISEEDILRAVDIKYVIGKVWHARVYGMIYLRCSKDRKYHGLKECARIPVKCIFIYE